MLNSYLVITNQHEPGFALIVPAHWHWHTPLWEIKNRFRWASSLIWKYLPEPDWYSHD